MIITDICIFIVFSIISPPLPTHSKDLDFKVTKLHFKIRFIQNMFVFGFDLQQHGIVNVEMVNCNIIVNIDNSFNNLFNIENWSVTRFETFTIRNVTFEDKPLSDDTHFLKEEALKERKSLNPVMIRVVTVQ